MFSFSVLIVLSLPFLSILYSLISLLKNVRIARRIGIPYIIVPVYAYNRLNYLIFAHTVLRFCNAILPPASNSSWRRMTSTAWGYKLKYAPFEELGTDTFLTVAPGGIILYTADADVIHQVSSRGNDFPKDTELYKHVDIYGKNVVSSEGAVWRRHRAITSAAFTEKNNQLVWKETIDITQSKLANFWAASDAELKTVSTVASDAMKLSLEVIGRAGLGKRIERLKASKESAEGKVLQPGHEMTFTEAMQFVLSHIFYLIALPMWLLKSAPVKKWRKCYQAYIEWGKYLQEMIDAKRSSLTGDATDAPSNVDLITQLLKAQEASSNAKETPDHRTLFHDSDVIGNLFMFIIAGHETSANSIHFSILLLAMHPPIQKQVQDELDTILQGRRPSTWTYDTDLKALFNSLLMNVINEQLRLIGPVIAIPKIVNQMPQTLTVNGKECTLPAHTNVRLCSSSVHFNPKYWPNDDDNDLLTFNPNRWHNHTPPRGAFIPFSDGQRACIGKRFAQIEILAALAVFFTSYSVELAVDDFASDEEVAEMDGAEKREIWQKARTQAEWKLREKVSSMLSLQMRGAVVPVKFVERGKERFRF